jgi:serine protease Do
MSAQTLMFKTVIGGIAVGAAVFCGVLFIKQKNLENTLALLSMPQQEQVVMVDDKPQVVERLVTSNQLWRPIQGRVKDAVVQIFSNIAEMDILQPYKTPSQGASSGSGFFINANGDIITNAHVVDEAKGVWIQIPSFGKTILDVDIISVNPDRDLALLRLRPEGLAAMRAELGEVPFLPLGDSDRVRRSDEVLVLGYPLGQQALKSTTGVVSGREHHFIQTSAAINPGNSGGPLLNAQGEVVGINSANIPSAQNVGYAIPINDLRTILPDMYEMKLLRKPYLGILFTHATPSLVKYLGNPKPGGCYVVEVIKNSTLEQAGVKPGDMIYEIDGHKLDIFGEMNVPWGEDKLSLVDYVGRLSIGQAIKLIIYRNGERKEMVVTFKHAKLPAVHKIYPGYEDLDYEVFGGMVVVPMTLNHVYALGKNAPGLAKFVESKNQVDPVLLITHIFPNSQLYRSRALAVGMVLKEVNGIKVPTLKEFREAVGKPEQGEFLTLMVMDTVSNSSDKVLIALPWKKILEEEPKLARDFRYPMSDCTKDILRIAQAQVQLNKEVVA